MITLPTFEAKTRLSELLTFVEQGEQVTITRRGQAIAKLVAVNADGNLSAHELKARKAAMQAVIAARKGRSLAGLDIKAITEEGRD